MNLIKCSCFLFLTVFITLICQSDARLAKRQVVSVVTDTGNQVLNLVHGLTDFLRTLPLAGGLVGSLLDTVDSLLDQVELATNGLLGRLLGGALPCSISLKEGIVCRGAEEKGGMAQVFENSLDQVPSLLLPSLVKNLVKNIVMGVVGLLGDILLGGQPK